MPKKIVKMYLHGSKEDGYHTLGKLGLTGEALRTVSGWAYEVGFDVEVDMETGETKIISCDGRKLQY